MGRERSGPERIRSGEGRVGQGRVSGGSVQERVGSGEGRFGRMSGQEWVESDRIGWRRVCSREVRVARGLGRDTVGSGEGQVRGTGSGQRRVGSERLESREGRVGES